MCVYIIRLTVERKRKALKSKRYKSSSISSQAPRDGGSGSHLH